MKKRFREEQIIRALKENAGGKKGTDIIREMGISEQTFIVGRANLAGGSQ